MSRCRAETLRRRTERRLGDKDVMHQRQTISLTTGAFAFWHIL
jgi:hypothetical protein